MWFWCVCVYLDHFHGQNRWNSGLSCSNDKGNETRGRGRQCLCLLLKLHWACACLLPQRKGRPWGSQYLCLKKGALVWELTCSSWTRDAGEEEKEKKKHNKPKINSEPLHCFSLQNGGFDFKYKEFLKTGLSIKARSHQKWETNARATRFNSNVYSKTTVLKRWSADPRGSATHHQGVREKKVEKKNCWTRKVASMVRYEWGL